MTIADFVAALGQYRLLEPAQRKELEQVIQARFTEPKALAKELVQRDWLTPYQGNQLLQGHGSELLLGSYVLLERLGEGGMGTVFKARNWKLGQIVAIKLIRKERLDNAAAVKRFQREIHACAQLNHPNIVRAFDADEVAGVHLLVMEFVDGIDLAKHVKQSGPLPVAQACECLRQAALGLQHAHEHGLIHRDIKPSNLLLTAQGTVKVLDLGLARMTHTASEDSPSTLTESGAVMGTPDYLAPEQARQSHEVDIRADLYSLGCTLYFLLTGKVPFPGGNLGEKLVKNQLDEPMPVEELRPEVPPEVAAIVRRLMAKKPEERYQTPAELEQALRTNVRPAVVPVIPPRVSTANDSTTAFASIMEPPSTAEAVDSPRRLRQAASRRRWLWLNVAGGGLLLGMLGVLLLLLQRSGTATQQTPEPSPGAEVETVKDSKRAGTLEKRRPEPVVIMPEPLDLPAGAPVSPLALVSRPAQVKGVRSWTIEPRGHRGGVWSMAYSPDGGRLASAGTNDGTIRLWESATRRLVHVLVGHRAVYSVAWSPDGKTLASAGYDDTLRLWDTSSGLLLRTLKAHSGGVWAVAWSPDGKILACGSQDQTVGLWDAPSGLMLRTLKGHSAEVRAVAWSPDGKTVASGSSDNTVRLWEAASGQLLRSLHGHTSSVLAVAWSPDGTILASGSKDQTVRLWERTSGKPLRALQEHTGAVGSVAWLLDGQTLAASDDSSVRLWQADSGQLLRNLLPGAHRSTSLAWSPDGKTLASGNGYGTMLFWDIGDGRLVDTLQGNTGRVRAVAWSPDGNTLASGSWDGKVQIWEAGTGRVRSLPTHKQQVRAVAWSPGGKTLASASEDQTVQLWNVAAGQSVRVLQGQPCEVTTVAWSPDDKTLASGHRDKTVRLWEAKTGKSLLTLKGHTERVFSVAWSPDGKSLASASKDETVRLWNVASGQVVRTLQGHTKAVEAVAWSPDGKTLVSGGEDGMVRFWEASSGQLLHSLQANSYSVYTVAWSPDGKSVATGGSNNYEVVVWEAATGKKVRALQGHTREIYAVAWSPDGKTLASASMDRTVRLWEPDTGRACGTLMILPTGQVAISPDGHFRGTPGAEKELVYVVVTDTGQETLTPAEFAQKYGWKNDPEKVRLAP
jgi:WD40 repeat protein/serine/threonine protein kinase